MPQRLISAGWVALGILGLILIAILFLVGRSPSCAAETGPAWKRRLVAAALGLLGIASGCNSDPSSDWLKSFSGHKAPASAPAPAEFDQAAERFSRNLDKIEDYPDNQIISDRLASHLIKWHSTESEAFHTAVKDRTLSAEQQATVKKLDARSEQVLEAIYNAQASEIPLGEAGKYWAGLQSLWQTCLAEATSKYQTPDKIGDRKTKSESLCLCIKQIDGLYLGGYLGLPEAFAVRNEFKMMAEMLYATQIPDSLAPEWKKASPQDRQRFLERFRELLLNEPEHDVLKRIERRLPYLQKLAEAPSIRKEVLLALAFSAGTDLALSKNNSGELAKQTWDILDRLVEKASVSGDLAKESQWKMIVMAWALEAWPSQAVSDAQMDFIATYFQRIPQAAETLAARKLLTAAEAKALTSAAQNIGRDLVSLERVRGTCYLVDFSGVIKDTIKRLQQRATLLRQMLAQQAVRVEVVEKLVPVMKSDLSTLREEDMQKSLDPHELADARRAAAEAEEAIRQIEAMLKR
ncbi:MAG: hypothetical protein ABFD92_09090 [Planctomycetaceae bacterium]|nr:hypothetical protein [Planctomycetaceae bacterium]